MGLKLGQNITFWPFLGFCSVFGRDTVFFRSRPSFLVATQFSGRDTSFLVATNFLDNNWFFFSNLSGP